MLDTRPKRERGSLIDSPSLPWAVPPAWWTVARDDAPGMLRRDRARRGPARHPAALLELLRARWNAAGPHSADTASL